MSFRTQIVVCLTLAASPAVAGDWPQILGPTRNGTAEGENLRPWPPGGPGVLWTYDLGEGYAGPAVASGRAVVYHRVGDAERLEALEAATGRRLWQADFPASYRGGVDPDRGPRCVPLVHGDRVFVCGAAGDLHCVALSTGRKLWSRATAEDFNALEGYFGAGSTPLVVGEKLLVNVGGRDEAGLVAFELADGRTAWQATRERASYSSPTSIHLGGRSYAVFVTRLNTCLVDPASGELCAQFAFGQRGPTVNAAAPLVFDDLLFVTANYGVGAKLTRVKANDFDEIWASDDVLSSQYPTPVYHNGYLYGVHGREDVGVAELRCVEARSGDVCWSVPGFGMAHGILAGDRLLILTVGGRLMLAEANPESFEKLAVATISSAVTRALPALANGRLYVRENQGRQGRLTCYALDGS